MVNLSSVVARIDALIIQRLGIPTAHAFGLAELVKNSDGQFPAAGETNCAHSDVYPLTWYHRATNGTVGTDTASGRGRQAFQQEKWNLSLFAFADRTRLDGMLPDELYRRISAAFPIFDGDKPFDGLEISGGEAAITRFDLDKYRVLASEFGAGDKTFGPEMIAIQVDYSVLLELLPNCVVLPCVGTKKC